MWSILLRDLTTGSQHAEALRPNIPVFTGYELSICDANSIHIRGHVLSGLFNLESSERLFVCNWKSGDVLLVSTTRFHGTALTLVGRRAFLHVLLSRMRSSTKTFCFSFMTIRTSL